MNFKVKEFKESLKGPVSLISGKVTQRGYILTFDGASYSIPVIEVGEDSAGNYALIPGCKIDLHLNYFLCVDVDYTDIPSSDEPAPTDQAPGCRISFRRENRILETISHNPLTIGFLNPPEFALSVYFSSSGRFNGSGFTLTDMHDKSEVIN